MKGIMQEYLPLESEWKRSRRFFMLGEGRRRRCIPSAILNENKDERTAEKKRNIVR